MKPTLTFETLELPVAELGPESSVPDLMGEKILQNQLTFDLEEGDDIHPGYGRVENSYPYRQFNTYTRTLTMQKVDTAVLENRHLRAVFLPGYGGRLWSLEDKAAGRNLLYTNDVLQFSNLAVRNAWFSGGVEWNIGIIGHNPFTTAPLYTARLEEKGVPVLRMYEYEQVRGVCYQMDFWLGEEDKFLNCRFKIINENSGVTPMYWWSNIAVPEYEGGRVVVPAEKAYTLKNMCVYKTDIPVVNGVDVTAYNDIPTSIDYFFDIPEAAPKFIANLDRGGWGLLQRSTGRLVSRKLFCWGNQPASDHWQEFLTQKAGRYVEIQAGLAKTQYGCLPMPPRSEWEWVEQYGPVQLDPALLADTHRRRYEAIEDQLAAEGAVETMERLLKDTAPMARRKARLVRPGSAAGALARRGETSAHLEFRCEDQSGKDWAAFLESGVLHCPDPDQRPDCFLADEASLRQLKATVEGCNRGNWYAHYQLGVRLVQNGEYDAAEKQLLTSLELAENPWAYHALACLEYRRDNAARCAACIEKGAALRREDLSYQKSAFKLLSTAEAWTAMLRLYESLPEGLRANSYLTIHYAIALHRTGRSEEAFALIADPASFVVEDIREGEDLPARLWTEVTTALGSPARCPMNTTSAPTSKTKAAPPRQRGRCFFLVSAGGQRGHRVTVHQLGGAHGHRDGPGEDGPFGHKGVVFAVLAAGVRPPPRHLVQKFLGQGLPGKISGQAAGVHHRDDGLETAGKALLHQPQALLLPEGEAGLQARGPAALAAPVQVALDVDVAKNAGHGAQGLFIGQRRLKGGGVLRAGGADEPHRRAHRPLHLRQHLGGDAVEPGAAPVHIVGDEQGLQLHAALHSAVDGKGAVLAAAV